MGEMNNRMKSFILLLCFALALSPLYGDSTESNSEIDTTENEEYICGTYFGGIGCHSCEDVAKIIIDELFEQYPQLVLIVYELEEEPANAEVIGKYSKKYRVGFMVPILIFNKKVKGAGGKVLKSKCKEMIKQFESNKCPLADGEVPFDELDISSLPGKPQLWMKDRILIKEGKGEIDDKILHKLLTTDSVYEVIKKIEYKEVKPENNQLVDELSYRKAIRIDGWLFQWEPYYKSEK